ncbi:MAG: FAD-dependent oxidoreductase [Rhizobiaceae bacterium]|nr:FAD-dependent oxidoreductase [Rhizobiaceae bacterium]
MPETRDHHFAGISKNGTFDVIVIGGGINGIGVFRELSLQGLRVLLVERNDFCSGCSAAPSRMIHGGLRYLENGEFSLVRESLQERDALLKNAPHMVKQLPTTVPIRSIFSGLLNGVANFLHLPTKPSERGALAIKAGLMMYDWVTRRRRILPKHNFRGPSQTRRIWPHMRQGTRFSATYYDAWISHPERLGLELLQDAEAANSDSMALNYADLTTNDDDTLTLTDNVSGKSLPVTAKAVINATGAWVDRTSSQLPGRAQAVTPMVEGTKGSHLIIDNAELKEALGGHMIYFENADGRVCILFPYLSNVLVGATDIRVETPCRTRCEDEEKDYILGSLKNVFPDIDVTQSQIVFSYSGIRPLPKSDQAFTGRISRSHFVKRLEGPIPQFCMIGGKWTTFRAFAEQATNDVLNELGKSRTSETLNLPIGGGRDYPTDTAEWIATICTEFDIKPDRAQHLLDHYGANAGQVLTACEQHGAAIKLSDDCSYTFAEIAHLARSERIVHLSDLVLRRTDLAITGQVSTTMIANVAKVVGSELGWSAAQRKREIEALTSELNEFYGVCPQTLSNRSK